MNRWQRMVNGCVWILIFILGVYILGYGMRGQPVKKAAYACAKVLTGAEFTLQKAAARLLFPGLMYTARDPEAETLTDYLLARAYDFFPLYGFVCGQELYETEIEGGSVYERLLALETEENREQETADAQEGEEKAVEEPKEEPETPQLAAEEQPAKEQPGQEAIPGKEYSREQLADYEFVKSTFYTISPTTDIGASLLDGVKLTEMDMTLKNDASEPQILIYHTHSQEGFVDTVEGDPSTTIVGVGDYLTELLTERYGYNVIHNTNVYDVINGKLDRNKAYSQALPEVEAILAQYPSIEVVIDLHRDGVDDDMRLVTEVNGKPTAKFMFFNGLSYSARNGPIEYLNNPYIENNLAFSLQLQLAAEKYYPGVARRIFLKSLRYNMHVCPRCILVEAGAQTNTLEEMKNAMEPLSDVLHHVLGDP